jgi:multiple sugar transport system permease protein
MPSVINPSLPLRTHLSAWTFMAPAVLSVALWAYYPLARGMVMAFQDYRILGGSRWVGLDNFVEAFGQETFWRGITNSFFFTLWLLGLGFVLPIVLALLLNEIPKGKGPVPPAVLPARRHDQRRCRHAVETVLGPRPTGLFNMLIGWADKLIPGPDIGAQKWLQDPNQAMFAVVLPLIWAGTGPASIIYLAALQSIPDEMYEAADLDGASFFAKIWRVTLPTLSPVILINLVGRTIGAFKIMEPILVRPAEGRTTPPTPSAWRSGTTPSCT